MTDLAIRVENLSKRYRLGQREPYKILRDAPARAAKAPLCDLRSTFQRTNDQILWKGYDK